MRLEIDELFPWVLMTAGLLAFQCLLTGFIFGGGKRTSLFTKELLEEKFGEEHKKVFGREIQKGGYPDHGNGKYSELLEFKELILQNFIQTIVNKHKRKKQP